VIFLTSLIVSLLKLEAPNEKPAYPPSYNELYPNMVTSTEIGWQPQPPPPSQNPIIIDIDSQNQNLSITPRQSSKKKMKS
jgi:hypothetical protein